MHFIKWHFFAPETHPLLNTILNDTKHSWLQHKALFATIFSTFLLVGVDVVSSGSETDNTVQAEYFFIE
jgi:hypothetical protein